MKTKKLETIPNELTPTERFFYANAAYSYDARKETRTQGRIRCAKYFADAETRATRAGFAFQWTQDDTTNREWTNDGDEYFTWSCAVWYRGAVVDSLSGCDFGPDGEPWGTPYARVVQAELASQVVPDDDDEENGDGLFPNE